MNGGVTFSKCEASICGEQERIALQDRITHVLPSSKLEHTTQFAALHNRPHPRTTKMTRQTPHAKPKQKRRSKRKATDATGNISVRLEALSLPDQLGAVDGHDEAPMLAQPVARPKQKRCSRTIKISRGFRYTRSWFSAKNITYRCSTYRTSGCKAVLKISPAAEWRVHGDHICRRGVVVQGALRNETAAMKTMTDRLATEDPGMPEDTIWEQVCAALYGKSREELLEGLTEEQVLSRVRRVRRRYYGGDIHSVVEVPPCSKVKDSAIPFFRIHLVTAHPDPNAPPNRILGWAHPAFKELLLYNSISLFIDVLFDAYRDSSTSVCS
jgi:hypothetical protein